MSMATLEREIVAEARVIFNNPKLRNKDLREWSTGEIAPDGDDEVVAYCPTLGVFVCIFKRDDRRK